MNEIDKMRKSELADMEKPEIQASFIHAKKLLAKMRTMTIYDGAEYPYYFHHLSAFLL